MTAKPIKVGKLKMQTNTSLSFVLIHGGLADVWIWDRVTPLLDFPALALSRVPPDKPLTDLTISDCAAYAQSQIEAAELDQIILVAHSIGGILAPPIATLMPDKIKHIVFIGAVIPPDGQSGISTFPFAERIGSAIAAWLMGRGIRLPDKLVEKQLRDTLCNDMDEATVTQFLAGSKNLEPPSLFFEKASRADMPPVECTYIKLLQDKGIHPPNRQDEIAANIGAKVVALNTGHTAMLRERS